jgi:hypothetical protein
LKFSSQTRAISGRRAASRLTRADARLGSARQATWVWYVDGAIGRTLQIGSTPWTAHSAGKQSTGLFSCPPHSSMNAFIA